MVSPPGNSIFPFTVKVHEVIFRPSFGEAIPTRLVEWIVKFPEPVMFGEMISTVILSIPIPALNAVIVLLPCSTRVVCLRI